MSKQGLEVEKEVKLILQKEFGRLTKQKLLIGKKKKEIDLVTDDKQVLIEVKSSKCGNETTGKAGYTGTSMPRLVMACALLDKRDAKRKILALTNKELHEQFSKDMSGYGLFPTVEIRYVSIDN